MTTKKLVRNVFMVVIFTIIIISFAFFGLESNMFTGAQGNIVAAAGNRVVDREDFKREFEGVKQEASQQERRPISTEELGAQGGDQYVLNSVKSRLATLVLLDRVGVRPSLNMMSNEIRKIPAFFDEVSGNFDTNAYGNWLQERGLNEKKFRELLGAQVAGQHLASVLEAGSKPPATLAAYQALMMRQTRDVSVLYVTPAMVGAVADPTDAQLTAFMNQNAERLKTPEQRAMTIVRFDTNQVMASVTPTEQDIQALIDFRKDEQTVPEARSFVQIAVKDKAAAQTVASRLGRGEDAATVARAVGSSIVQYDNKPKTAIPDAKTADAAFALTAGQTSAPIEGALGISVVRLISITPARLPDMAKLRTEAVTEAKRRAAQAKVREQSDKLEEEIENGKDLATAAREVGAQVIVTQPVFANGQTKDGRAQPGITPAIAQEAGQLQVGERSDIKEEKPGEWFMVRVEQIVPPALPPLAEARTRLIPMWRENELQERREAKVTELAAKVRQGGDIAEVARQAGASVTRLTGISYSDGGPLAQKYTRQLVENALQTKKGEVFTGSGMLQGANAAPVFFVGRVDDIHQADAAAAAPEGQRVLPQIARAMSDELNETIARRVTQLVPVKTYPDRARAAVDLPPLPVAGAAEKGKDKEAGKAPAGGAAKK